MSNQTALRESIGSAISLVGHLALKLDGEAVCIVVETGEGIGTIDPRLYTDGGYEFSHPRFGSFLFLIALTHAKSALHKAGGVVSRDLVRLAAELRRELVAIDSKPTLDIPLGHAENTQVLASGGHLCEFPLPDLSPRVDVGISQHNQDIASLGVVKVKQGFLNFAPK